MAGVTCVWQALGVLTLVQKEGKFVSPQDITFQCHHPLLSPCLQVARGKIKALIISLTTTNSP